MIDKKNLLFLILISLLFFASKWIISYYLYLETTSIKVIFESVSDGYYYFPLVKYLSNFDLNNSFNPFFENLNNIMLPFYSIFVHSFFYKFIGSFVFIIGEYIATFLFLLLFYKIFILYYSKNLSLLYTLVIFCIPIIFSIIPIGDLTYFKLIKDDIFTLRFPRPLITSLYLFFFMYFIISLEKIEFFTNKNLFILGIILATTLSSFYYFFFLQISVLGLYMFYRYKISFLNKLYQNWKALIVLVITFTIFALPMFINMILHEPDYTRRLGLISLDFDQKKVLLFHYLTNYLRKEFIILLSILTFYMWFINHKKILNYKLINYLYLFFFGSILAPILFIIATNKSSIFYHYNNTVVIFVFLLILFIFLDLFSSFSEKYLNKIFLNVATIILITFCISVNIYNSFQLNLERQSSQRSEFTNISNIILNNYDLNKSSLMTFDNRFMVWSVLNNIKYLNITNFIMTPKKDQMIEDDMIKSFKFLNIDSDGFNKFIENKKSSWRYINYDLSTFFFYKYMANSIKTYNNSQNFSNEVSEYIKNSSPINFQQSIIPNEELERLRNKFLKTKLNNFNYPDLIILNKKNKFLKDINKIENYCKIFDKNFYILLVRKDEKTNC